MRKKLLVGNWKMNLTPNEEVNLARELSDNMQNSELNVEVVVAPSFSGLVEVAELLKDSKIEVAAQNCAHTDKGALTGEESVESLLETSVSYVILGHSERRTKLNESDALVAAKVRNATSKGLTAIVCVGETMEVREDDKSHEFITTQLHRSLHNVTEYDYLTIAYEPLWAISTNASAKPATSKDIEDIHELIRSVLKDKFGKNNGAKVRILYGGSVDKENISDIIGVRDVDGVLVGHASLDAEDFLSIGSKM